MCVDSKAVALFAFLVTFSLAVSAGGDTYADQIYTGLQAVQCGAGNSHDHKKVPPNEDLPCSGHHETKPDPTHSEALGHYRNALNEALQSRTFISKNSHRSFWPLLRKPRSVGQKSETQDILDLLETGEKSLRFDASKKAILILGNTGAGKSTFTHFITGNSNLISQEKGKYTDEFIIIDTAGQRVGNSTITSFTVFPELVTDAKTNITLYDCPGFSDTRDLAHDIAATYLTKRVLENVEQVKLIFLVNHSSLKFGENRQDFMILVRHAVSMIKNVEKFNESIALIVTKVNNQYTRKGLLVSDEKVTENVANFLREVREEIKTKAQNSTSDESRKIVQFIDILLKQEGERYEKLGIFRRPDEPGPLNTIPLLQDGKKSLEEILHNRTQYAKHKQDDFGYTISAESHNHVHDVVEIITQNIASSINDLSQEMLKHFHLQEKEDDIQWLYDEFIKAYDGLLPVKETKNLKDFVALVDAKIENLEIHNISKENLTSIVNYDRYLEFLSQFTTQQTAKPSEWMQGFDRLLEYLNISQKWYNFLINLYSMLSDYKVQQDVTRFENLTAELKNETFRYHEQVMQNLNWATDQANLSDVTDQTFKAQEQIKQSLKRLLDEVSPSDSKMEFDKIKHVKLDNEKIFKMSSVLDLIGLPLTVSHEDERLEVMGQFVKISEVSKYLENNVSVEIFALEKVFIDADLDLTGRQAELSILAPTWDIIESPRIILDGAPGKAHYPRKAGQVIFNWYGDYNNDMYNGVSKGLAGANGQPGGPAGKFLGIGQTFINGHHLSISLVGGMGGPGQMGSDGGRGQDGTEPPYPGDVPVSWRSPAMIWHNLKEKYSECSRGPTNVFEWIGNDFYCTFKGKRCTNGGNGGSGGRGGTGGPAGWDLLIGLDGDSGVSVSKSNGMTGIAGEGGLGGEPGQSGTAVTYKASYKFTEFVWRLERKSSWDYDSCRSGWHGPSGYSWNTEEPVEVVEFQNPNETINQYINYVKENSFLNVRSLFTKDFLHKLENNEQVKSLSQLTTQDTVQPTYNKLEEDERFYNNVFFGQR